MKSIHERLVDAAGAGDAAQCSRLISQGADPRCQSDAALAAAASRGHADCVRLLMALCDPKSTHSRSLYFAAANAHAECVKLLIPVSDPKAEDSRALLISAQRGHLECVRLLLPVSESLMKRHALPPLTRSNSVPLYAALDRGQASVFSAMLAHEPRLLKSLDLPPLLAHSISQGHADLSALLASIIEQQALSASLPTRMPGASSPPTRL